jgi:hypothetical protein
MIPDEMAARLAAVIGKACWHVGAGGRVGSSFSLALGGKVRRDIEAIVKAPAWDLSLRFGNGCVLSVFCDHLRGDASIEQNWELWQGTRALLVGPGYEWRLHDEDSSL